MEMAEITKIDTSVALHFIEDDVLYIIFKNGVDVDIEGMKESKRARLSLQKDRSMKVLVDTRGVFNISKEARAYAAEERHAKMSKAMAIISDSLPTRLLTNFFVNFNKPNTPTKVFNNMDSALTWLSQF